MSPDVMRRGWCPSLHAPMQTHDGWLVRVTPDLEGLGPEQLAFLAKYAARFGNGRITVTSRGNLQLRGLDEVSARDFPQLAAARGLGLADPEAESRRRILFVSPLAGKDSSCAPETLPLARALEAALISFPPLWRPPEKFSLAVDGGGHVPVGALRADIALRHDRGTWRLCHGPSSDLLQPHELIGATVALLKRLTARIGMPRALHLAPPFMAEVPPLMGQFLPGCHGVKAVLGEVSAASCAGMARAGISARLTPWRGLILDQPFEAPDLMHDPADPRRLAEACAGQGGCARGQALTQRDALSLVPDLGGRTLHVSGCAKGCAVRDTRDVTLVAQKDGYDLIWYGTTADRPVESGLSVEDVRRRLRQSRHEGRTPP